MFYVMEGQRFAAVASSFSSSDWNFPDWLPITILYGWLLDSRKENFLLVHHHEKSVGLFSPPKRFLVAFVCFRTLKYESRF